MLLNFLLPTPKKFKFPQPQQEVQRRKVNTSKKYPSTKQISYNSNQPILLPSPTYKNDIFMIQKNIQPFTRNSNESKC